MTRAVSMSALAMVLLIAPMSVRAEVPLTIVGAETVSTDRAKELFDEKVKFIDVRAPSRFSAGHIPNAINLDAHSAFTQEALMQHVKQKDDPFVVYCDGLRCGKSAKAALKAVSWGFTKVYYFREGYPVWIEKGYPIDGPKS